MNKSFKSHKIDVILDAGMVWYHTIIRSVGSVCFDLTIVPIVVSGISEAYCAKVQISCQK